MGSQENTAVDIVLAAVAGGLRAGPLAVVRVIMSVVVATGRL